MKPQTFKIGRKKINCQVSAWFFPYTRTGRGRTAKVATTLPWILENATKSHGVYIIKREGGTRPLYIGYSESNLYKTFYRHFQHWREPNHQHATYKARNGYQCRVIVPPHRYVHDLEKLLVAELEPRDNHLRYTGTPNAFGPAATPGDLVDMVLENPATDWQPQPDGVELPF